MDTLFVLTLYLNIVSITTQCNECEGNFSDDIYDLCADDTLDNTAEGNFIQTEVGSNASNNCQSPVRERPQSYNSIDHHENIPDEEYDDDEVTNPSIYHIMER